MEEIVRMSFPKLRELALKTESIDVLCEIMKNCKGDAHTIQKIIENPYARFSPFLISEAFKHGDTRVKCIIARHTDNESIINDASCSDDRSVRSNVALNPNISLPILVRLSEDSWWGVRVNALSNSQNRNNFLGNIHSSAENPALSIPDYSQLPLSELRERAAETESLEELWTIFENCKGDAHTIQKIIENPYARHDPQLVREAYDCGDDRIRTTIARNTADESIINKAIHADRTVRMSVALNPNISMENLILLSKDLWWGVRVSVLSNARVTHEIVWNVYQNDSDFVVRNLARNILDKMVSS